MQAIVQKAKKITTKSEVIENGMVVFLSCSLEDANDKIGRLFEKLAKIRIWQEWKRSATDLGHSIVFAAENEDVYQKLMENKDKFKELSWSAISPRTSWLSFVNDGPCTFIFCNKGLPF